MQHEQLCLLTLAPGPGPATAPKIPPCHACAIPGCGIPISRTMLMCIRHWLMVPKALQSEVWRHYRPGQEEDMRLSQEYLTAAKAAIQSVLPPAPVVIDAAEGAQALEEPVIEPRSARFLIGDRVCITQELRGRDRPNPEDKKNPFLVWFLPWQGRSGIYCGTNAVGLALVDFGVGLPYPIALEKLAFAEDSADADG